MVNGIMNGKIKSRITAPRMPVVLSILGRFAASYDLLDVSGDISESKKTERHVQRSDCQTPEYQCGNEPLRKASPVVNHHSGR